MPDFFNKQLGMFDGDVLVDVRARYGHGGEDETRRDAKGRLKRDKTNDEERTSKAELTKGTAGEGTTGHPPSEIDNPKSKRWPGLRHANSRAALEGAAAAGRVSRKQRIIEALEGAGRPLTDREILRALGRDPLGDPNYVRPRVTDLLRDGVLVEVDTVICRWSGEAVRRTKIKD